MKYLALFVLSLGGGLASKLLAVTIPTLISETEPAVSDAFGSATALSESHYAIINPGKDGAEKNSGSILLYSTETQELLHEFSSPTGELNVLNDATITLTEKFLIAGIPKSTQEQGKVLAWDVTSGTLYHTFSHPAPEKGDRFGHSISAHGNRLLIGAPKDEPSTTNDLTLDSGSAFLFDLVSKQQLTFFTAEKTTRDDTFGTSVSLTAEKVIIGSPSYDLPNGEGDEGAIYVYDRSSYALNHRLTASDSSTLASLGFHIATSENLLLATAYRGFSSENTCYLFNLDTGEELTKLSSPNAGRSTFGFQVAIGGTLIIGDHFSGGTGAAYLYGKDGTFLEKITSPAEKSGDQFAINLAAYQDTLLIGAKGVDLPQGLNTGAAYLYGVTQTIDLKIQLADGNLNLIWESEVGKSYTVLFSETLKEGSWSELNTKPIVSDATQTSYLYSLKNSPPRAFFKVVQR